VNCPAVRWSLGLLAVLAAFLAAPARAQVLDEVSVIKESGNRARVEFHFTEPTQLIRYFPDKRGKTLSIWFHTAQIDSSLLAPSPGTLSFDRLGGRLPLVRADLELNGGEGDRIILRFNHVVDYQVRPDGDGRTIVVTVPLPSPKPASGAVSNIGESMARARRLLIAGKNKQAIAIFSRIVALPENRFSQVANELLGLSYERAGDTALARRQYRTYLRKYPKGDGADRVRQRLRNLAHIRVRTLRPVAATNGSGKTTVYGSWSQQLYTGATTTASGTSTDQEALISALNLSVRRRSGSMEYRMVLDASHNYDFLSSVSDGRVQRAYVLARSDWHKSSIQLGRQSPNGGGVLGYYDGIFLGTNVAQKWRIGYVAGVPFDPYSPGSDRKFSGFRIDAGQFAGHWSGSMYSITNTTEGLTDRDAIGGEFHYVSPTTNVLSLVDYDHSFSDLNIFLLQGYWQHGKYWSFYTAVDARKSPLLQLNNSLLEPINGTTYTSVRAAMAANPGLDFMQLARDRTARSLVVSAGATHTLSQKLQLGTDLSFSQFSGLPASAGEAAIPEDTSATVTGRMVGTELLHRGEVSVLGLSLINGSTYNAVSAFLTDRGRYVRHWQIDVGLKAYLQANNSGTQLTRLTPSVRVQYSRGKETFDLEIGREHSSSVNPLVAQTTDRDYLTLGYRYDF
jgi:hypothetical protein